MNLERASNEEKLELCRKYYFGGFLMLPFLWVVNVVWFYKHAFCLPPHDGQAEMRKYVTRSAVGAALLIAAFVAWNVVFQLSRASWGEMGDRLSFIIPHGQA